MNDPSVFIEIITLKKHPLVGPDAESSVNMNRTVFLTNGSEMSLMELSCVNFEMPICVIIDSVTDTPFETGL